MFNQAHKENCMQLELERKAAERDKLNTVASPKRSEKPLHNLA